MSQEPAARPHPEHVERPIGGQTMYAAVFDGLREGSYTLLTHDAVRQSGVMIRGAEVTTIDWRTS